MKGTKHILALLFVAMVIACGGRKTDLETALELAGNNRKELEAVLDHYKDDPEKLAAAKFLIENMPAHYSYSDPRIEDYYAVALEIFKTKLSPNEQNDSLLKIKRLKKYPNLESKTISDVRIMTEEYLIYSIDHAFNLWKTKPWNAALSFDEFCEWLLPYKVVEKQSFDHWRDTLPELFTKDLNQLPDDDESGTAFKTLETVRNEMYWKQLPHGIYTELAYPMLSASTMARQTFGRCGDYVTAGVATFRSLGLPVIIDESPLWGRHRMGHSWYTMISDRGEQLSSEWDISRTVGKTFFPYEQIPKVFRNKFAVNK